MRLLGNWRDLFHIEDMQPGCRIGDVGAVTLQGQSTRISGGTITPQQGNLSWIADV